MSSKSRAICWARSWSCQIETVRVWPESSSKLKPIAGRKTEPHMPTAAVALTARKQCLESAGLLTCLVLGIDRQLDKADLLGERVWIEEGVSISPRQIARGPRVGIEYAESWIKKPWRFWVRDNPFVSKPNAIKRERK